MEKEKVAMAALKTILESYDWLYDGGREQMKIGFILGICDLATMLTKEKEEDG